jgi:microcompartment protein CcmK/EutM
MKLLSTLTLLVSAVAANPMLHTTRQATDATKPFHLKTADASNEKHNNLYVYAYHTGAGFNDAVLTSDVNTASTAFLNGTYTQFDLKTPFPWGFNPIGDTNYAR